MTMSNSRQTRFVSRSLFIHSLGSEKNRFVVLKLGGKKNVFKLEWLKKEDKKNKKNKTTIDDVTDVVCQ